MELKITQKPISINSNSRIFYRIIILLLIMHYTGRSKNKRVPLLKIHLLVWALQSIDRQKLLLTAKENDYRTSIGIWNIDINTNKALGYMYEDKLCNIDKKNYELTEAGKNLVEAILEDKELFKDERDFLSSIGKSLSDKKVMKLRDMWIS